MGAMDLAGSQRLMQDPPSARSCLRETGGRRVRGSLVSCAGDPASVPCHPHNSRPRPANAAALLRQEETAPQQRVPATWIPTVPMPLLSNGADRHQQWEWSNALSPPQRHQPPERSEPPSTKQEHGGGGGGQWCSRGSRSESSCPASWSSGALDQWGVTGPPGFRQ